MLKTRSRLVLYLSALVLALLLSGCAPVISDKAMEGVDAGLVFAEIIKDPERYAGARVVVGGIILGAEFRETETVLEVLSAPLDKRLRPMEPDKSAGRFRVVLAGFKDPAVYSPGRRITVAGTLKGIEPGSVGKTTYNYPVVTPIEFHLWSLHERPMLRFGVGLGVSF